jgi:hypothetical protein
MKFPLISFPSESTQTSAFYALSGFIKLRVSASTLACCLAKRAVKWSASFCTLFSCHELARMNSVSQVITANLGLAMLSRSLMIRVKLVKSRLLSTSPLS